MFTNRIRKKPWVFLGIAIILAALLIYVFCTPTDLRQTL